MLDDALAYAARGLPVFPCRETQDKAAGSKAPYLRGESRPGAHDGGHWLASFDAARIRQWWRRWPHALIGLPTGLRSSCVVVDLDPRSADLADMVVALRGFLGGSLREPAVAITQSGGAHLFYRYPAQTRLAALSVVKVENRTNLFRAFLDHAEVSADLAHIDVRAEGGYVIAAPSIMADGKTYYWRRAPEIDADGLWSLPDMPQALLELICGLRKPRAVVEEEERRATAARSYRPWQGVGDARVRAYVQATIAGALEAARNAGAGNRNAAVHWAACRLSAFVRGGQISRGEAESLLLANLPQGVSPTERKILGTIKRGLENESDPAFSADMLGGERAA